MSERLLRFKEVLSKIGLSRTSLWRLERKGLFPKRRAIGPNSVAWIEKEIDNWIQSQPTVIQSQKTRKETNLI